MTFSEFKTQLSADLWETFTETYYVYDNDDSKNIEDVKDHITNLIEGIKVVEDDISEEEVDKLIEDLVPFIYKNQLDHLDKDDLEFFGETFWCSLTSWASKDSFWYDREIGGIYDDNDEGGLYAK